MCGVQGVRGGLQGASGERPDGSEAHVFFWRGPRLFGSEKPLGGSAGADGAGTEGAETSLASSLGVLGSLGVFGVASLSLFVSAAAMDGTTEARLRVGMRGGAR